MAGMGPVVGTEVGFKDRSDYVGLVGCSQNGLTQIRFD